MQKLDKIVCNASPVIALSGIGKLDLLWEIFDEVYVPDGVYLEVTEGNKLKNQGDMELKAAIENGWIKRYQVKDFSFIQHFLGRLHQGELEVVAAAKELNIRTVVIDDLSARKFANTMLLNTIGIVGILILAKKLNMISEIKLDLDKLIENNYRISAKLYNTVLNECNEM